MLSNLVIAYLFCGGAGAGAIAAVALLDLAWVRTPFGRASRAALDEGTTAERTLSFGLLVGLSALALGMLCLLFDLGRIDRVASLFTSPTATYMSFGVYALTVLAACAAVLAAARFLYLPDVPQGAVRAVEALAVAAGVAVMLYTGLLLQDMDGVRFWCSPFVPVLFLLSSTSCGIALVLIVAFLVGSGGDARVNRMMAVLARVDAVVIACEAVCAALLLCTAAAGGYEAAAESVKSLVAGELAFLWWCGFATCGLAVPLAVELAVVVRRLPAHALRTALAAAAVLVLVGGVSMRLCIVEAGEHAALEFDDEYANVMVWE